MENVGDILKRMREKAGLTLRESAELSGIDYSGLSKRERNLTGTNYRDRKALAKAYGISLTDFEAQLEEAKRVHSRPAPKGIPVINRAPAGMAMPYDHDHFAEGEYHGAHEYIDRNGIDDEMAFAVVIVGDSMMPLLNEGDYVVFTPLNVPKPRAELRENSVVFVRFGGDDSHDNGCTIARWSIDEATAEIVLKKDNPEYKPIRLHRARVSRVAVAIERRSKRFSVEGRAS